MDAKKTIQGNIFDGRRFMKLVKSEYTVNKGTYLKFIISTIGVFLAIAILACLGIYDNRPVYEPAESISRIQAHNIIYLSVSGWLFCLGLTIFGSLTFSSMSSKKGRIATIMQPASMTEKFLLRMIIYLIGGVLMLIAGFMTGVLVCQLVYGGGRLMMENFGFFFSSADIPWKLTLAIILTILFGNSLYTLGSALWPRLSWLKTWVAVGCIQWIIGIFLISGILSSHFLGEIIRRMCYSPGAIAWWSISILILINLGCWALAWWRFRNTQIVQRFMKK